nr:unnamed protein product [Callosobruchus analis]
MRNGRNAAVLWALHGYLVPKNRVVKKGVTGKKTTTKFAIKDSQESVLFVGPNQHEIEERINRLRATNVSDQPSLYCIGKDIFSIDDLSRSYFSKISGDAIDLRIMYSRRRVQIKGVILIKGISTDEMEESLEHETVDPFDDAAYGADCETQAEAPLTPFSFASDIDEQLKKDHPVSLELEKKWHETETKLQMMDLNDYSVYTGTSGVALLKMKRDPTNLDVLKEALKLLSLNRLKGKRHTFLCGDAGPLAIGIHLNHLMGKSEEVELLCGKLKSLSRDVVNVQSDLPNEYLYGRAGYLYAILYVNKHVTPQQFDDEFVRLVSIILFLV